MVNSREYMKVTYSQIDKMKHTIGFINRYVTGTKHRKYKPYRNYYAVSDIGDPELEELVRLGFMEKISERYFHVTEDGKLFLKFVTGVEILADER